MDLVRSHVLVCAGAACVSAGCKKVCEALKERLEEKGLENEVLVVETGCMGPCDLGPLMVIYPEGTFYQKLTPEMAVNIVDEHILKGRIVKEYLYQPRDGEMIDAFADIDYFKRQTRIALRNTGVIDPEVIEEYIALDGFLALATALTKMKPDEVIDEVKKSDLRGRGGGGFPTGLKWSFAARSQADQKYVVCNADEGDPGAFMDRSILEGDPFSIIEAMTIAGYAIGASRGYIYVRAEYPLAIQRLKQAIKQAKDYGFLGKNILGKDFEFDLEIRVGAGAFVCGEETALLISIEGKRGEPRPRPPFPAEKGLWDKPTVLNNVETYANIPPIILRGAEWFNKIGTEKSKGTKVFALAGKVVNTGLVEVPMGTSLGEIIYDIGGGIPGGKKFKAVQTGGPSGGCVPINHLNTSVDYESLLELGTMMGSGGMIVMDEGTCMVDLARFFLEFIQEESCGKCAPCRVGTKRMLEILERICHGEGVEEDIAKLLHLGEQIQESALCGLGQTAANPVVSTIKYFRSEYEAHIREKRCPASVCASLFESACQNSCPAGVRVPAYIALIKEGRYADALKVIREENPFPGICGRVCHHPCEEYCQRAQLDAPVAIRALKRFAADFELEEGGPEFTPVKKRNNRKVAIIGAGPAGLSAAYYLALLGYSPVVFESQPEVGGMFAIGIPPYRLPREILNHEVQVIKDMGVEIKTEVEIGKDITLEELQKQGFERIFVGVGTQGCNKLDIPGEDLEGVYPSLKFLWDLGLGEEVKVGKKVAVVGGGNAAIDAARSALRLGAEDVKIIYRRRQEDMPALEEEIHEAMKEGIEILTLTNPTQIIGKNGKVVAIECMEQDLGEFDNSGRRRPVPNEEKVFRIEVDTVIPAIGQFLADGFLPKEQEIKLNRWYTLDVDPDSLETSIPGVYAGGDCVTGANTVIDAIAAGKKAAASIDKSYGSDGEWRIEKVEPASDLGEIYEDECPRNSVPMLADSERLSFREVEKGYTRLLAMEECKRCLRCDTKQNQ